MRRAWALVAALAVAGGCNKKADGDKADIEIGALLTTSGDLAGIGTDMLAAAQLAVQQVNEAGGVLGGKRLSITNQDDRTDEQGAADAAQAHVDAGIPAFTGAVGSGFTLAAAEVASGAGVVMISPSSTSPAITDYADDGYLFRTCPSDALQGTLLAQRALANGHKTAAIIYVPGPYGEGMADAFEATFKAGGSITDKIEYKVGENSYVQLLTDVFAENPDVVAMPVYPVDGAQMINDYLTRFPNQNVTFLFADALANDDFISGVGANNFNFPHEGTAPSTVGPQYAAFATAYEDTYGDAPGTFLSNAYDATMLIALAIEAGGEATGPAIRDNLTAVSSGGAAHGPNDVAGLLSAISAGEDVDYEGASSSVDFDGQGDIVAPYGIWEVAGGGIKIVEDGVLPE